MAVSLFNKFGAVEVEDITDNYLRTRLWDAARNTIAKYNVIEIYGEKSSEASGKIQEEFSKDVGKLGFHVDNLTLGVPKADKKTQEAIDERVKATQELERKQTEKKIAKEEAERQKIEAKGIAEANDIVSKSMTKEILTKEWLKKWNGETPVVVGEGGSLIQLPLEDKK
jgi:regulator of protease activity HflC (stomatin/prohibitin superfamily)